MTTAQIVESAISHIFTYRLPLNPENLQKVLEEAGATLSKEEVTAYMAQEYGWNENFSFVD